MSESYASILRQLCRAMATTTIARHFVAEFSEEIATIPEATKLAASIMASAEKSKVVTAEERNAGHALYRIIRDAFEATLKSKTPAVLVAPPMPPVQHAVPIKRCPTTDENGQLPKEKRPRGSASSGKSGSSRTERVDVPRATIALPPVKVNVIPETKRAAARMAFFADARRVALTQTGITYNTDVLNRTDWNAVNLVSDGLDPAKVMKDHRDIIAATPEGLRLLTEYEHHQLGAHSALDIARRVVMCAHRNEPLPEVLVRHWNAYPPNGTCTAEQRQARAAAEVKANAQVREGRGWVYLPEGAAPLRYPVKGWSRIENV